MSDNGVPSDLNEGKEPAIKEYIGELCIFLLHMSDSHGAKNEANQFTFAYQGLSAEMGGDGRKRHPLCAYR
jgi:hypothetical protein